MLLYEKGYANLARASCSRRQSEHADSSSPTSARRQRKRKKPLDVAPYSGKGFKSSTKLRRNHLKRGERTLHGTSRIVRNGFYFGST
uniref:60S ribosomal protein L37 n=1 Tax=Ascaris lumbricoides TaxID=6252 RepID=A0A0M3ISX0_ASCLU